MKTEPRPSGSGLIAWDTVRSLTVAARIGRKQHDSLHWAPPTARRVAVGDALGTTLPIRSPRRGGATILRTDRERRVLIWDTFLPAVKRRSAVDDKLDPREHGRHVQNSLSFRVPQTLRRLSHVMA